MELARGREARKGLHLASAEARRHSYHSGATQERGYFSRECRELGVSRCAMYRHAHATGLLAPARAWRLVGKTNSRSEGDLASLAWPHQG